MTDPAIVGLVVLAAIAGAVIWAFRHRDLAVASPPDAGADQPLTQLRLGRRPIPRQAFATLSPSKGERKKS